MGRSTVTPIQQPDGLTCGPAALKHALASLGIRRSMNQLIELCKTTRNGTSTRNMVTALNKLGLPVLVVEYATLHHLQSALRYPTRQIRAALVSYLYEDDEKDRPHPDSGHWAMVSGYHSSKSRIVLLDSATARKKSYNWTEFRNRWIDFDLKRRRMGKRGNHYKLIKRWQSQLLMVIARQESHLPKFRIQTASLYSPRALN